MLSPMQQFGLALGIRKIYEDTEHLLLSKVTQKIAKDMDVSDWERRKLAEVSELRKEADKIAKKTTQDALKEYDEAVTLAYFKGIDAGVNELEQGGIEGIVGKGGNKEAIKEFVKDTQEWIPAMERKVLRQADDVYYQVIREVGATPLTGAEARRKTAQRALNKFASRGIGTFTDKSGRSWDIASYTEMATRTAVGKSSIQGHKETMRNNQHDLVLVTEHDTSCELCIPYEQAILSISGKSREYESLSNAESNGLFHPNCRHNISAYIEGLTETEEPELTKKEREERYKDTQKQQI